MEDVCSIGATGKKWFLGVCSSGETIEKNACGNPATVKNYFWSFAGVPQRWKTTFWPLRESRNDEKLHFGLCGNPATMKNYFLAFAGVPQAFPKTDGLLLGFVTFYRKPGDPYLLHRVHVALGLGTYWKRISRMTLAPAFSLRVRTRRSRHIISSLRRTEESSTTCNMAP